MNVKLQFAAIHSKWKKVGPIRRAHFTCNFNRNYILNDNFIDTLIVRPRYSILISLDSDTETRLLVLKQGFWSYN
jgi:hypothetical protein